MFTEGTYVDASGVLRDADGNETGFAVETDGGIISTDGANDTGGAYIDATGQVFYGDDLPMQGVVVAGDWPRAVGGSSFWKADSTSGTVKINAMGAMRSNEARAENESPPTDIIEG